MMTMIIIGKGTDIYDWMSTTIFPSLTALRYYNGKKLPLEDQYYTDELVDYRTSQLQMRQLRVTERKDSCTLCT